MYASQRTRTSKLVVVAVPDAWLRSALVAWIEQFGVSAVGAADGGELFGWLEPIMLLEDHGCSPDLVVTDVVMKGIDPLEVVEGLAHVGCDVPVIVLSDVTDYTLRGRVHDLGFRWIEKPVVALQLERAIRDALATQYAPARM